MLTDKILNFFNVIIAFFGTWITWLFGSWNTALEILILFMALDYITGVIKGFVNKKLSSDIGLSGIARKTIILAVLIVAVALDRLLNSGTWVFRTLVCYFYIANEGLSILENCTSIGLPIPDRMKDALLQIKNKKN